MECEIPITYIHHKNEQKKKYTKEQIERARKKAEMIRRNDIHGIVELPDNIENEYKELDKREIGILNKELNGFVNEDLRFYLMNNYTTAIGTNFNEMYNVLFCNKKLEDVKDKMFNRHSDILTEMLLEIVNCDEYRYRRYDIDISSSNSTKKKQEIKKVCEKLFLNILTRKYNILREQDNLDFKLPSREEKDKDNELLNKFEQIKNDLDSNKSKILE